MSETSARSLLKSNVREYGMVVALLVIVAFFQWKTDGVLLTPLNITNIVLQNSYIVVMALGMLLVIVAGHIDLSVGSVAAFVGAIAGNLIVKEHWNWPIAIVVCVMIGIAIGAWHGYWIAYQKIPSFIVTLASMLIFRGLTLVVIGEAGTIGPFPKSFGKISAGYIGDIFGSSGRHLTTIVLAVIGCVVLLALGLKARVNERTFGFDPAPTYFFVIKNVLVIGAIMWLSWTMAGFQGYPNVFIVLSLLIVLYTIVSTRTVIGRRVYAVGGNLKAADLSGVKSAWTTMLTFVNMGALAALGGIVFAARLNSATPKAGDGFELDVIAACFIGGASASGGVGRVSGAVIGAFVIGVMNNGMSIMGIDVGWQRVIKGLVLLAAVWFDVYNKRKNG